MYFVCVGAQKVYVCVCVVRKSKAVREGDERGL